MANTLENSAFTTTDKPYLREQDLYSITEFGNLKKKILVDLDSKDIRAFWKFHENKLWFIIFLTSFYFLLMLI